MRYQYSAVPLIGLHAGERITRLIRARSSGEALNKLCESRVFDLWSGIRIEPDAPLEGFDEFWRGYLLGLAFTGSDSEGEPIYDHPGQDIREVCDTKEIEVELEILRDALSFFIAARSMISNNYEKAGSDFHLTRNGHGCGFWNGDWPEHGDTLTTMAEQFGECELSKHNEHLYIG